jgi:teichuronic acid biosynthesis glycosyltransferase TuaH
MKGKDFVITSLQTWDMSLGTTIRNFTLEIAKKNRVIYVNTPMDQATLIRCILKGKHDRRLDVIKKKLDPIRRINDNLWVIDLPIIAYSVNKIPNAKLFDLFNYYNGKRASRWINRFLEKLSFKEFTLFIDTDIYRSQYLKELLSPKLTIYYRRDYILGVSYWKKHGTRLEPLLAAKADIAMGNSRLFCEELGRYNPNVKLLETGVNLELYDGNKTFATPMDVINIPKPIVGYVGSINDLRLDESLLFQLAKKRSEYSFVFVGPEDAVFKTSQLHSLPNCYFTGSKKTDELPDYVASFDICINPQKVNEITEGNYPLKIDEYLAMGKPSVATETPIMTDVFSKHVHLAHDETSYLQMIDKAVKEASDSSLKTERIQFAKTHSWESRCEDLYRYIYPS